MEDQRLRGDPRRRGRDEGFGIGWYRLCWGIGGLILVISITLTVVGCVPKERRSPHAVYIKDNVGDCVAIFSIFTTTTTAGDAKIQHVNKELCQ